MPSFGPKSRAERETLHPFLQEVLDEVIEYYDFSIIEGHRNEAKQSDAFESGASKVEFPDGNHNLLPSMAGDLAPYPIDYSERSKAKARFYFLMGCVKAEVENMNALNRMMGRPEPEYDVRFGLDWDGDGDFLDQSFDDIGHVEIKLRAR